MRYDDVSDMPDGMRKLWEAQLAREKNKTAGITKVTPNAIKTPQCRGRKRKYNNQPTERLLSTGECVKFGSKTEACYYDKLILMEKAGQVRKIRLQVEYLLKPSYTDGQTGERFPAIKYFADFTFDKLMPDGAWKEMIVDTKGGGRKGTETRTFILKRKLMADLGYHVETANKGEF